LLPPLPIGLIKPEVSGLAVLKYFFQPAILNSL
jgi:hypothetical protein